jgi:8-oxo-dGTP pyrophosphatase MutT (NUDIX family)
LLATRSQYRLGSVMMLLYPGVAGELCTVFIERPVNDTVHSGQIAFPGGKSDPSDTSLAHTALRETEEEIGITQSQVEILGTLSPLFIPASNFLVHPHIGWMESTPAFRPNPEEVQALIQVPVEGLIALQPERKQFPTSYGLLEAPYFPLEKRVLWGATAMMVSEFREMMRRVPE